MISLPTPTRPASAALRPSAQLRQRIEDFVVDELLEPAPPFAGEHLWLHVRKTGLSTPAAVRRIAEVAGIDAREIGYAGLKDERSVSGQWFSIPARSGDRLQLPADPQLGVLAAVPQSRKLRRGMHRGNRFVLVLRGVTSAVHLPGAWRFPNYFGTRRFGTDNVETAIGWLAQRRRRRISRFKQGIYLSVLRALLFNEVLVRRVAADTWCTVLAGDVCDASGAPTGPLWGRGRSAVSGVAAVEEQAALAAWTEVREGLEFAGVDQARRSLVGVASDVASRWLEPGCLQLEFTLPVGSYATTALDEWFEITDHVGP